MGWISGRGYFFSLALGMRKLLLMGLLLFPLLLVAQTGKQVEREIAVYLKSAQDSLRQNVRHTLWATQRAIDLARTHGLKQSEQSCYLTLARFYKEYNNMDFVVVNYDRAIAMGLSNTTQLQFQKLPYLEHISDKDKALRDAQRIADLARRIRDKQAESTAMIVLGNIHGKLGNNEKSLEYLQKAEALVSKDDIQQQAHVQGYLGDHYSRANQPRKAETYYKNSIDYGNQVQDTSLMVTNFERMNDVYQQENRGSDLIAFNGAIRNLRNASASEPDTANAMVPGKKDDYWVQKVQNQAGLNLAAAHLDNHASEEAITILEELKDAPVQNLSQSGTVHKLLSRAYDQSGQYAQALAEYKAYVAIQDSLLKEKDIKIEAALTQALEMQKLESHIMFLEKDKVQDTQTISLKESNIRRQQTIIIASCAVALIVMVSLVVAVRKSRAKTAANNLLQLKSLRTKMNPHFIFNSLNSVNHFIAQNDEKAANRYLSQFSKLMREVLDSSDKDFIPLEKEIELLKIYLNLEHQRFERKFDYRLDVDDEIMNQDFHIPPMLVQPFIENAIWHGLRYIDYPGFLFVRFSMIGKDLHIEIEDNGIGREASLALKTKGQHQHRSSGISNSRSRVELINKVFGAAISIHITDKTGAQTGTLVQIVLQQHHGS
jgi:two-component system, LytTR family, sensor kinase